MEKTDGQTEKSLMPEVSALNLAVDEEPEYVRALDR
jgi:hypothetical protein